MLISRRDDTLHARIAGCWPLEGVRAGSGLSWIAGRLLVVQDDVLAVALVEPRTRAIERVNLDATGRALAKSEKPDFEASVRAPNGIVYVLGSGSSPKRRRIARVDPATREVALVDAGKLYDRLAERLGTTPNLEGAVHLGDRVRLLHRGAGDSPSAVVDVPPAALDGTDAEPSEPCLWDLGRVGKVSLGFTDAAPFHRQTILYLAVAEDTPNAIDDGAIVGSAIGLLDVDAGRWTALTEADGSLSLRKAEGLALDPDGRTGWLVTDPDDAARPAELCRVELGGHWR